MNFVDSRRTEDRQIPTNSQVFSRFPPWYLLQCVSELTCGGLQALHSELQGGRDGVCLFDSQRWTYTKGLLKERH